MGYCLLYVSLKNEISMQEDKKYIDKDKLYRFGNRALCGVSVMLYWCFFALILAMGLIYRFFGNVDLSAVPFLVAKMYGGGINFWIEAKILGLILIPSLLFAVLFIKGIRKFYKYSKISIPPLGLAVYLFFLLCVCIMIISEIVGEAEIWWVYFVVLFLYVWMNKRNFDYGWFIGLMMILGFGLFFKADRKYDIFEFFRHSLRDYEVNDTQKLLMKNKRNVIVVFAESLEDRHTRVDLEDKVLKIDDEDAVKFLGFTEGKLQGDTLHALGAFLQGIQLEYAEDVKKVIKGKEELQKARGENLNKVVDVEKFGVGNVLKHNEYRNIFVKGADLGFAKTDEFLLSQGFLKEDMYGLNSFGKWEEYLKSLGKKGWWAPKDEVVFEFFKERILEIDENEPFFAVMFTADWHAVTFSEWKNPFYATEKDIQIAMIEALNDFIKWYKVQKFYDNTTLIIVGDHRKMGNNEREKDEKLYNAFFNLPEELKKGVNKKREFNQIDLAPSVLEIAGVVLDSRKYGTGVSIFSDKKTLAEKINLLR